MSFKKILVPVTGAGDDAIALATAFVAARPFAGHVEALFVRPDPREAVPFVGMPISPEVVQQIIDNAETVSAAAAKAAHVNVAAAAKAAGAELAAAPDVRPSLSCSLREVQGAFISQVAHAARLSDLVVFGPSTLDAGPDLRGAFIETLTQSERPVLLAPVSVPRDLTRRIAVGWDGSFTAARALSAALPLLRHAGAVDILLVESREAAGPVLAEAVEYLALHGIPASPRAVDPGGQSPGEVLLKAAEEDGASLLVLGGYGHNRMVETLFGGTTAHIAAHAILPLFMVH